MKVDLLESGKEDGRTREKFSRCLNILDGAAQARPPDNETVVQNQCRSVGQNTRDIETTGNWGSGTSPVLSSSYSSYIPLTVIYKSLLAHQMTLSACYLQFALLLSSPEEKGEYWAHCVIMKYFCWVTKLYAFHRIKYTLLQSARFQIF